MKMIVLHAALTALIVNVPGYVIALLAEDGLSVPLWLFGLMHGISVVVITFYVLAVYTAWILRGEQ